MNPKGWIANRGPRYDSDTTEAHISAIQKDIRSLNQVLKTNPHLVNAKDKNGWTPLHESVRSNCYDCVINLIQKGADVNAQTVDGSTPLRYARIFHEKKSHNNAISHFLQKYGARELGPEL